MRPVYIRMTAFGSYVEEEVDFSAIPGGLFLITGDTGAGKTTIFDAITFALYGTTSGGKRDGRMMRSQYAPPSLKTEVTYRFEYAGQIYEITRSPEQPNYRLDSLTGRYEERKTKRQPQVSLILPDGSEYPGRLREVNQKIEEIIGLTAAQFTLVAMLAQGDFLKLLLAKSEERQAVFAKIFDTGVYRFLERRLAEEFREAERELSENRRDLLREMDRIRALPGSVLPEEWTRTELREAAMDAGAEGLLDTISTICREAEEQYRAGQEARRAAEEGFLRLQQQWQEAENVNRLFRQKEAAENRARELEGRREEMEAVRREIDLALRANAMMPSFRAWSAQRTAKADSSARVAELSAWIEENRDAAEKCRAGYELAAETAEKEVPELTARLKDLEGRLPAYREAEQIRIRREQAEHNCRLAEENLERRRVAEAEEESRRVQNYEALYHRFVRSQAAVLRRELREGEPCPVCGSVHHILAAEETGSEEVTDAAALDRERTRMAAGRERGQKELEALQVKLRSAREEMIRLRERQEYLKGQMTFSGEEEALRLRAAWKARLQDITGEARRKEAAWREISEEMTSRAARLAQERENLEKIREALARAQEEFAAEGKRQGFSGSTDFQKSIRRPEELRRLQTQAAEYDTERKLTEAETERLARETEGKQKTETEGLRRELEARKSEREKQDQALREQYAVLAGNRRAEEQCRLLLGERSGLRERYLLLNNLNNTAGGRLGRRHISLETYMQRQFFRHIIDSANVRLREMSRGQFLLHVRDMDDLKAQGQVGLDLDVYSIVNEQYREVETLSGGESFMAALAMALGLSDSIRMSRGSVHIDTMFIDEGFGSLSEDTRNQAVAMLAGLAEGDHLVGIISHVTELKEQIETKLLVKRTDRGSSARWEG